jgi:hypothetical protein
MTRAIAARDRIAIACVALCIFTAVYFGLQLLRLAL